MKQIYGQRHGHMVKLPGNIWSLKESIKRPKKKWIPKKGTMGYKLDSVSPSNDLLYETVDPTLKLYAYQVDAYPKNKSWDPVFSLCNLTRTAEPISLASLNHSVNSTILLDFISHVEGCCNSFNNLFHQKKIKLSDKPTPLQLDTLAKHYSSGFLQSVIFFLFARPEECGSLLADSYLSANLHTAAFWRHSIFEYRRSCHNFQFHNFIDLMVRSSKQLAYRQLSGEVTANSQWAQLEDNLHDVCKKRLVLFKETQQVEQYPGFIKETIYPYNHTLLKVVQVFDSQFVFWIYLSSISIK